MASRAEVAIGALALTVVLAGCGAAAPAGAPGPSGPSVAAGFTNPVYDSNFPDPMIVDAGDGSYVAYATNGNGANVQTLQSSDLVTWRQGPDALPQLASWSSPGKVWAPEVARAGDRWLLYYTTRSPDPELQCVGVASATSATGPFTDDSSEPLVCESDAGGSIDAHPFTAADGTRYLYWKNDGNAVGVDTWISVQRLSASGTEVVGEPTKLIKQDLAWEGELVEAPYVWEHEGSFWLFYSANSFASAEYAVGVARGPSPTGPFTKVPEPVLVGNDVAAGPGHCSLLAKDGRVWMAYHAWAPDAIGSEIPGRTMWLSEVTFGADGVSVQPPQVDYPTRP